MHLVFSPGICALSHEIIGARNHLPGAYSSRLLRAQPGSRGGILSLMNKEQLKKNVGDFVRLIPIAHRLDAKGHPLPRIDDEWRIESVADEGVRIFLPRTGHGRTLGFDHICEYTSDRVERGVKYGFLTLKVQLAIQGNDVNVTPTRPGVSIPPRIPLDPIRLALFRRLQASPGQAVHADHFPEFPAEEVTNEIARCDAEGLLEARLLHDGRGIRAAVALRLKRGGAEWIRQNRSF